MSASEITITIWTNANVTISGAHDAAREAVAQVRRSTVADEVVAAAVTARPVTDEELRFLRDPDAIDDFWVEIGARAVENAEIMPEEQWEAWKERVRAAVAAGEMTAADAAAMGVPVEE